MGGAGVRVEVATGGYGNGIAFFCPSSVHHRGCRRSSVSREGGLVSGLVACAKAHRHTGPPGNRTCRGAGVPCRSFALFTAAFSSCRMSTHHLVDRGPPLPTNTLSHSLVDTFLPLRSHVPPLCVMPLFPFAPPPGAFPPGRGVLPLGHAPGGPMGLLYGNVGGGMMMMGGMMGGRPPFAPRPPSREELVGRFKDLLLDKGVRRRGRGVQGRHRYWR